MEKVLGLTIGNDEYSRIPIPYLHTRLECMNQTYQLLRLIKGKRETFFNDIRALFNFIP